jgi:hypothetical protein
MGIFSSISNFVTHDIFDPVNNVFGGGAGKNTSGDPTSQAILAQTQALTDATNASVAATEAATKAEQDAQLQAEAAATPPTDSESSRAASDDQLRKTLAGGVYGIGLPTTTGAAPVGYRLLSGS